VKHAVDALLAEMRSDGNSERTIETAEFRLSHFFQLPQNVNRPLRWLTHRGEELYAAAQVDHSADTHHAELALAKRVGVLCVERRWLRADPFAKVKAIGRKRHGSTKPRLRVDESRALFDYCLARHDDQCCVIAIAYLLLGSRASELACATVRELDDDGHLFCVDKAKTTAGVRRLSIPEELRDLLLELAKGKRPDSPLFTLEDGRPADRHWAYRQVRRITKEAKVCELSPQGLRRTQSDMATVAGVSALEIARHLGQRSTRVTDRSYRDANVIADARAARAFRVIVGGKR
jgi:integrase